MSRLASPFLILTVLAGGVLLLIVAAVPGVRHRHAGDVAHSHGQSHTHSHRHTHGHSHRHHHHHGHSHSHSHGHSHTRGPSHSHADEHIAGAERDGWHIHVSIFGFELTLWDSWSVVVERRGDTPPRRSRRERSEMADDGRPVLLATSPTTSGWMSVFWLDPAPVPRRVASPPVGGEMLVAGSVNERVGLDADPPPVPPPEAV